MEELHITLSYKKYLKSFIQKYRGNGNILEDAKTSWAQLKLDNPSIANNHGALYKKFQSQYMNATPFNTFMGIFMENYQRRKDHLDQGMHHKAYNPTGDAAKAWTQLKYDNPNMTSANLLTCYIRDLQETQKALSLIQQKKQDDAARTIQKFWKTSIANPKFQLCQKRLIREFQEMI